MSKYRKKLFPLWPGSRGEFDRWCAVQRVSKRWLNFLVGVMGIIATCTTGTRAMLDVGGEIDAQSKGTCFHNGRSSALTLKNRKDKLLIFLRSDGAPVTSDARGIAPDTYLKQ